MIDQVHGAKQDIGVAAGNRTQIVVDLAAIQHNARLIQRWSPNAKVMAVLKRNAYGMGAESIAHALSNVGIQAFAVDNVAEGIRLRDGGIEAQILVIDGDVSSNARWALEYRLTPGIPHEGLLEAYERVAKQTNHMVGVWLVYNAGFNRSGYKDLSAFRQFVVRAKSCQFLSVLGVYAHLTNSNAEWNVSWEQIHQYAKAVATAQEVLAHSLETSIFASHGIVRWASIYPTTWVRPGLILYGENALVDDLVERDTQVRIGELEAAVSIRARVTHVQRFVTFDRVGYGLRYSVKPGQTIATLSIGFGSGYPFHASDLEALVGGTRVPVFGEVGMDAMQIDVSAVPSIRVNDWVTLIGEDGDQRISIKDIAHRANTTPYQLMAGLRGQHVYSPTEEDSLHDGP